MENERLVTLRPRTVVMVSAILIGIAASLWLVWIARHVITWILVAFFLALAIDPAVQWLQRHGVRRRGAAAGLVYLVVLAALGALGALFVPVLVDQVEEFVDAVPGYIEDITAGRGPLGFLETEYDISKRVRDAVSGGGSGGIGEGAGALLDVTRSIVTGIVGVITIAFMTLFMLLEGPVWMERFYSLMPSDSEPRWRAVGSDIYRIVGGYVSGNLAISFIAATASTIVLLITGVPFPLALGLLVFILDLIPLAGATIAAVILALAAFAHSTTAGIVVAIFFVAYQQIENHLLQPLVYGRTVQISPLMALIAVLIGAEVAGVLGALGAIPIAGSLQALARDLRRQRAEDRRASVTEATSSGTSPPVITPPG